MNFITRSLIIVFSLVNYQTTYAMEPVVTPHEKSPLLASTPQLNQTAPSITFSELLIVASASNDLKTVQHCLEQGADINGCDVDNDTALHAACNSLGNNQALVAYLLARGAVVTHSNKHGFTPLHNAAACNNVAVMELLKQAGASPDAQSLKRYTPCYTAVRGTAPDAIAWLHANRANMNSIDKHGGAPMHWAIYHDDAKTLHQLIEHGGQIDIRTQPPIIRDEFNITLPLATCATPFHVAAFHNRVSLKKVLLYHALLFDPWNKEPHKVSFLDMLIARDPKMRAAARSLLARRAHKLQQILLIQDSVQNSAAAVELNKHRGDETQVYFSSTMVQRDMVNFLMALEAHCLEKLNQNNMFKAAHDELEDLAPLKCVIC